MVLKIYEFSRGIKVSGTPDNWHSQGFTGELMNCTFNPVPEAIKTAISNRLFAVAERGATDIPALVGREVEDEHGQWSVMAVVTRGRDDGGRPFSAYRYFWCEGSDKLVDIAHWWTMQSKNDRDLIFDPFDEPEGEIVIEDKQKYSNREHDITDGNFSDLTDEMLPVPVIVDFDRKITPVIVDRIAIKKVGNNLLAWAYNVEALEAPRSFQVILPASQQAEEAIRRVVNNQSQVGNTVQDEPAIKKAISLLSQNKVKPEHLKTIEDALGNPAIDDKYWRSMFDSQGASTAIKESSYSPQLVRLLTLRAIVIPETLPQFFDWLNKKDSKDQIWTDCLDFQAKITKNLLNLPNLKSSLLRGVKFMMLQLLDSETYVQNTAWLCTAEGGCWANIYKNVFRQDLKDKLKNINASNLLPSSIAPDKWDKALDKVIDHLQKRRHYLLKEYFVLANFFFMAKDYRLATIFCHVSAGDIPPEVFKKLNSNHPDHADIYGIRVYRKIGTIEKIGGSEVKIYYLIPLLIIVILGSGFATYFGTDRWFRTSAYNSSLKVLTSQVMNQKTIQSLDPKPDKEKINQAVAQVLVDGLSENPNLNATPIENLSCQVAKKIDSSNNCVVVKTQSSPTQQTPLAPVPLLANDIDTTNKTALGQIVSQLKEMIPPESQKSGEQEIKDTILQIIKQQNSNITSFDYIYSISQGKEAIKKYQTSKKLDVDGVMSPGGQTATRLKCEVVQKLGSQYFPNPVSGCN